MKNYVYIKTDRKTDTRRHRQEMAGQKNRDKRRRLEGDKGRDRSKQRKSRHDGNEMDKSRRNTLPTRLAKDEHAHMAVSLFGSASPRSPRICWAANSAFSLKACRNTATKSEASSGWSAATNV